MTEAEKKALIERIIKAGQDLKAARIAATVFTNQAEPADAVYFIQYLNCEDLSLRRMAFFIVGHFGLIEALPTLKAEVQKMVRDLTFLPDAEYKEDFFYSGLIEIFETIFAIVKKNNLEDDQLIDLATEIFKKTTHPDLRFVLIKFIALRKTNFDFLFALFNRFGDKEKRALYYVYSFVDHPQRLKIYQKGLHDEHNFEFVVAHLLLFESGRKILADFLREANSDERLKALKQMEERDLSGLEETLLVLLGDENRYVSDLSAEMIKKNRFLDFPREKFIEFVQSSFLFDLVRNSIDILEVFQTENFEQILLEAFGKQKLLRNRVLILEKLLKRLKEGKKFALKFSQDLLATFMPLLENYQPDYEDLIVAISRILPYLEYRESAQIKQLKKVLLDLEKKGTNYQDSKVKNNLIESVGKINGLIQRYEQNEIQIKTIFNLFSLSQEKISAERLQKLQVEIAALPFLGEREVDELGQFLCKTYACSLEDWKKRRYAVEMIGLYGRKGDIGFLKEIIQKESALGVKLGAEEALNRIRERYQILPPLIVLFENSIYLKKIIRDSLVDRECQIEEAEKINRLAELIGHGLQVLFIGENLLQPTIVSYFQRNPEKMMIIISSEPQKYREFLKFENIRVLKKPFRRENVEEICPYGKQ